MPELIFVNYPGSFVVDGGVEWLVEEGRKEDKEEGGRDKLITRG